MYIVNHIFKTRNALLHYRFANWPNHSAFKMKIVLLLLISLTIVVCLRIECYWPNEYLCGDQCILLRNTCHCGYDSFTFNQTPSVYCCQKPNTSCRKTLNGDIYCHGQKLGWNQPCDGSCTQMSQRGFTMLLCADQKECYVGKDACRGKPLCTE